jgi:hypothetical protein
MCLGQSGDYGHALEHLRRASSIAEEIEHREFRTTVHTVWGRDFCIGLLAPAEAEAHLATAMAMARELGSRSMILFATEDLALVYILRHELVRAQELLDTAISGDLPDAAGVPMLLRGCWAARAELELALGRPGQSVPFDEPPRRGARTLRARPSDHPGTRRGAP